MKKIHRAFSLTPTLSFTRTGTILIIVAGISGLLASIALTFIARIENSAASDRVILQESQARIMLVAACNYIQEASRIGWEAPGLFAHHLETFGWIDVRDGTLGPKFNSVNTTIASFDSETTIPEHPYPATRDPLSVAESNFKIGSPKRFPMYPMKRPPYAIQAKACYNPVVTSPGPEYDNLNPYTRFPDPLPIGEDNNPNNPPNGWIKNPLSPFTNPGGTITTDSSRFDNWTNGDPTPRADSYAMSWFRIVREPCGSTFVITCGAGGSLGWKDWPEVLSANLADRQSAEDFFGTGTVGENNLKIAQNSETKTFYRIEWSPAVSAPDYGTMMTNFYIDNTNNLDSKRDFYRNYPVNHTDWDNLTYPSVFLFNGKNTTQHHFHNMGGTILWVQRLHDQPTVW